MDIRNFHRICVGSGWPWRLDVMAVGGHESYGVGATAYYFDGQSGPEAVIQLRRLKNQIGLFTVMPGIETQLPFGWADSELLWDTTQLGAPAPGDLAPAMGPQLKGDRP